MEDADKTGRLFGISLHTQILLGLIVGLAAGGLANSLWANARGLEWAITYVSGPVGQIFLRLLLLVVVPLIVTTLILGVARLRETRRLGKMSVKMLGFFLGTTVLAAVLGLLTVDFVRPGNVIDPALRTALVETYASQGAEMMALAGEGASISNLVDIVPRNPLEAAVDGNLLAVIFVSLLFGAAIVRVPPDLAEPVLKFTGGVAHTVMEIIGFAMRVAPLGVAALTFTVTAQFGFGVLWALGLYTGTVLVGLAAYQFGLFGVIVKGLSGMAPRAFFRHARLPMITAFATASSSATLPTTVRSAEDLMDVPPEVAGFVLPLGATMNMNGTAFFVSITVVFLAQAFGIPLSLTTQGLIVVLAVLTSVSSAGIPSGAIPMLIVILGTVGVPGEGIALMLGVEPILGMARTSTNVTGDLVASLVLTRSEGLG